MQPVTFEVAPGITAIDTFYAGRERYTAAYLLDAREPALVETGPTTCLEPVVSGLAELGIGAGDLAHVLLTHIHLDHAGGVGAISERFPNATIWVHEVGAPHLADPTRLVASATRLYGQAQMTALFGPVFPVAPQRLRPLSDGARLDLGGRSLEAIHTPGHAPHQVALVDEATGGVFIGDALGIHVPDLPVLRPATPPPDVDVDAAVSSIERIRARAETVLMFAHFGPIAEVDATCDLAIARLRAWASVVRTELERTDDVDEIAARLEQEAILDIQTGAGAPIDLAALERRLELLSSVRMNAAGLIRYWKKREERERAEAGPQPS